MESHQDGSLPYTKFKIFITVRSLLIKFVCDTRLGGDISLKHNNLACLIGLLKLNNVGFLRPKCKVINWGTKNANWDTNLREQ